MSHQANPRHGARNAAQANSFPSTVIDARADSIE